VDRSIAAHPHDCAVVLVAVHDKEPVVDPLRLRRVGVVPEPPLVQVARVQAVVVQDHLHAPLACPPDDGVHDLERRQILHGEPGRQTVRRTPQSASMHGQVLEWKAVVLRPLS
jgi:hypothetical protein